MSGDAKAAGARFHDGLAESWTNAYEAGSFNRRKSFFLVHLDRLVRPGSLWLDAGCGSGVLARELAARGARVIAMDGSPAMIAQAAAPAPHSGEIEYRVIASIEQLPLGAEAVDGILCSSVLEYVEDPVAALREFFRVLAPAGVVIATVPNRWSLTRFVQSVSRRIGSVLGRSWFPYLGVSRHSYSARRYRRLLEGNGLAVECVAPFTPFLPGLLEPLRLGALWLAVARKKVG